MTAGIVFSPSIVSLRLERSNEGPHKRAILTCHRRRLRRILSFAGTHWRRVTP
jgi:hypothetical protein